VGSHDREGTLQGPNSHREVREDHSAESGFFAIGHATIVAVGAGIIGFITRDGQNAYLHKNAYFCIFLALLHILHI
jgi:hypothetical protein